MDYKNTLNLPSTGFPMKANLKTTEEKFLKEWDEMDLYGKMSEKAKEKNFKTFILHDGPPYANGHIHLGTALNKILKDIIIRFKFMQGYYAPYIPGWDCHGLPIEHNVDKSLKHKDAVSQLEKRKLCRQYAAEFVEIQKAEFKRLGGVGRYDEPYLTMNYSYEANTVRKLADFIKNGGLYRANKPIYWCSSCKTALAEAEVEYAEKTSPSIYVKFKMKSELGAIANLPEDENVFAVIWTTTPWTLPANLAISVNPDFDYVFAEVNCNLNCSSSHGKEIYILEESLAEETLKKFGFKDDEFTILAKTNGKNLENKVTAHPFLNRDSVIILGKHVKKDTGTGLVHTAPGHGDDDYAVGLKYNLPAYAPVNNEGRFVNDVEFFAGMRVFDSNPHVIEKLKETDSLVLEEKIEHSYPHCWRCKNPVILRSTKQWFISMSINNLRENALKAVKENVKWIPQWGVDRISGMLEVRPDWCVSRQRSWGVPITAFYCKQCGEPLIDYDITMKIADEFEKYGADIWFEKDAGYFLNEAKINKHAKCSKCGSEEFEKESDILDVWFDSGVSYFCVLKNDKDIKDIGFPADLYLEGSDQHRGWFHSSLLIAIGSQDGIPYRSVLTHGFVVDSSGRKMSKSLGNVIAPDEIINKYGADILRLWAASEDYKNDMRISNEILSRLSEGYRKIRNTIRFMLGNLYDFDENTNAVNFEDLRDIDKYEMHNIALLSQNLSKHYLNYDFHLVYQNIYRFVTSFSSFYLDIAKDSLYVEAKNSFKRRSIQTVIYQGLDVLIKYLAPILPFTSQEAWSYFNKKDKETELAFEHFDEPFNKKYESYIDFELAERFEKLIELRNIVLSSLEKARTEKTIGSSLEALVIIRASEEDYKLLSEFQINELKEIFIVSDLQIERLQTDETNGEFISEAIVKPAPGQKCARCWTFKESVGTHSDYNDVCDRCYDVLIDLQAGN